jgi:hypothetical protein
MNLINDAWLPVIRASGEKDKIAPWQIAERNDPLWNSMLHVRFSGCDINS